MNITLISKQWSLLIFHGTDTYFFGLKVELLLGCLAWLLEWSCKIICYQIFQGVFKHQRGQFDEPWIKFDGQDFLTWRCLRPFLQAWEDFRSFFGVFDSSIQPTSASHPFTCEDVLVVICLLNIVNAPKT